VLLFLLEKRLFELDSVSTVLKSREIRILIVHAAKSTIFGHWCWKVIQKVTRFV